MTTETASSIPLDLPYWFKQRQARAEPAAPGVWKLSGPNLPEAAITVEDLKAFRRVCHKAASRTGGTVTEFGISTR